MSDTSSEHERFPVRYVYHHNRYSGTLFDVDGNKLRGDTGDLLNVFKEELKDMMVEKKIRFMHYLTTEPTYSYFIVSPEQLGRFHIERLEGAPKPGKEYHVYPDY